MSEQANNPVPDWAALFPDFALEGVKVIATLGSDGGAIVENLRRLQCSESRHYAFEMLEDKAIHTFQYIFNFAESDDADPMASASVRGRIVIIGNHVSGHRLEIRGDGWIGYDDKGKLEGRFDVPPVIITDDWDIDADEAEYADEPAPRSILEFPMPPQFTQAIVRVPPMDEEWP